MAEGHTSLKVDFAGGMLVLGIFSLIVLFWGEPDLHDAIICKLMGPEAAKVLVDLPQ